MFLPQEQIRKLREALLTSKNPLFFFHDDPDGLCSFLLLYRSIREGYGIVIKAVPRIDVKFVRKVKEHMPDKLFVLDIAMMDQEFVEKAKLPIYWVDHHEPVKVEGRISYFNPLLFGKNYPVTSICYDVVKRDMWLAMCGCVGDWFIPPFAAQFSKRYPDLLPPKIKDAETALYETQLGRLIRMLSFILKGKTKDVMQCVKILTRVESPYEVLNRTTPRSRFLYRHYVKIEKKYLDLYEEAIEHAKMNRIILFVYFRKDISYSSDLANELMHRFPNNVIIVAREKGGEFRCSIRSKKVRVLDILKKALEGVEGYGGGHPHACGANIDAKDFERFVKKFEQNIPKS